MKKNAGFTLIELIVGILVMTIIFGGIVSIFGASVKSAQAGMNYKQAYESGRTIMDELKTTMRYADQSTISDDTANGSISYSTNESQPFFDKHYDIAKGVPYFYTYTISWKDDNKTQLKIVRKITNFQTSEQKTDTRYYPEDNYVSTNGAFKTTAYTALNFAFPIVKKEFSSDLDMYNIAIPFQYKDGSGTNKVEVLKTEVTPSSYSAVDPTVVARAKAEVLLTAVTAMYNDPSLRLQLKKADGTFSNISSAAFNQAGLAGISKNLKTYILGNNPAGLTTLGATAWILAPIDASGKIVNPTKDDVSVYGWRAFIAKNVVNDIDNVYKDKNNKAIYAAEAAKGNYIIRGGYGFLAYSYDSVGQAYSTTNEMKLGYMTGFEYKSSMVMVNYNSWVRLYTDLKSYGNLTDNPIDKPNAGKYIERNNNQNGSYQRLDYDASGAEYTLATCNGKGLLYNYNNLSLKTGSSNI